jgi:Putative Ig domain
MRVFRVLPLLLVVAACGSDNQPTGENLTFITKALSVAYNGEQYSEEIRLTSGTRPYNLKVSRGGLPPGLTLQNRTITGVVKVDLKDQERRVFDFTLEASDANLSVKPQDFKLEVRRLAVPTLAWQPAQTEVKTETRIPVILETPKKVSSARLFIPIPDGFAFKRLEPGAGRPIFISRVQGKVLRVDVAFTEKFNTIKSQTVMYLTLTVDGSRRVAGKIGFELRDAGKVVNAAKLETGAAPATNPATPPAPGTPPAPTPPGAPTPPTPPSPTPPGPTPPPVPPMNPGGRP